MSGSLTTLCFDLAVGASAPVIDAPTVRESRRYVGDAVQPRHMIWLETSAIPAATDLPAVGLLARERMDFTLARDVGRSDAVAHPWLYIVHTDIPDHVIDDYNAWYDHEHLPRLVAVSGVERARRYVSIAGGPRYLTAYELTVRDAFESPDGLKARKTPWTEKMRSLFVNTRRRMYRRDDV